MLDGPLLTAEEFLDSRFDLPESGQWAELHAGKVHLFQPPDLDYGTTVLNLSKVMAQYIQTSGPGYACFDLGILMQTGPDTIRYPAACYFLTGERFGETDKEYTDRVPELVIELTSTADRRQASGERIDAYHHYGVQSVWLIDPKEESVQACPQTGERQTFEFGQELTQPDLLPDFACKVETLFVEPEWWSSRPK